MTKNRMTVGYTSLREYLKCTYRHHFTARWIDGSWYLEYWLWWTLPSLDGSGRIGGERRVAWVPIDGSEADSVRYSGLEEAEEALWRKLVSVDIDAPFDTKRDWRRLGGRLVHIGTILPTGEYVSEAPGETPAN